MPGLMQSKNVISLHMKRLLERRQKLDEKKKRLSHILLQTEPQEARAID